MMIARYIELDRMIETRDSGISEYVIKPQSVKYLIVSIHSVIENPRQLIKTKSYLGLGRRRRSLIVQDDRRKRRRALNMKSN